MRMQELDIQDEGLKTTRSSVGWRLGSAKRVTDGLHGDLLVVVMLNGLGRQGAAALLCCFAVCPEMMKLSAGELNYPSAVWFGCQPPATHCENERLEEKLATPHRQGVDLRWEALSTLW